VQLWFEGRFITGVADAAALTTWTERRRSRDATGATTERPVYYNTTSARLINSHATVTYDGVDDHMDITDFTYSLNAGFHFYAVIRTGAAPAQDETIFSHYNASGDQRAIGVFRLSDRTLKVILSADGSYGAGTAKDYTSDGTLSDNTVYIVEFQYDMTTLDLYIDGALQTSTKNLDAAVDPLHNSTAPLMLGDIRTAAGDDVLPFEGDMGALVFGDTSLSSGKQLEMRNYLNSVYEVY